MAKEQQRPEKKATAPKIKVKMQKGGRRKAGVGEIYYVISK